MSEFTPALILLAGIPVALVLRGWTRSAFLIALPLAGALHVAFLPEGEGGILPLLGQELITCRVDALSRLFGILFHVALAVGFVYSAHLRDRVQQGAALAYGAAAVGAVFSGDLLSLFVWWELLALTSVILIWSRRDDESNRAGLRYLLVQLCSGLLLLGGVALLAQRGDSLAFGPLSPDEPAGLLILIAFGIKCAFPGLHSWLVDGYPAATPTGTVFLSGLTTKVAVFALARCFAGVEALVWIGTLMAVFPIFYAVIENDLRRVLGYSMINQIGFMVVGVGVGTDLALNGAAAHAFNDVFFKGLLFMAMGAVLDRVGHVRGSDLGGLYKTMPQTAGLCMVGAASISAFPLFSGFVSKSMIMAAAAEEHFDLAWFLLLFAAAGVFHHAGIKIPYFAFFAHDSKLRVPEARLNMRVAMALGAGICLFNGCYPWVLYGALPHPLGDWTPYDAHHVVTQLQLLFFSALAFAFLNLARLYPPELRSVNLDADWWYRRGARSARWLLRGPATRLGLFIQGVVLDFVPRSLQRRHRVGVDVFGRVWLDFSALVVAAMLLTYLLFSYLN